MRIKKYRINIEFRKKCRIKNLQAAEREIIILLNKSRPRYALRNEGEYQF